MTCPTCRKDVQANARFCRFCGDELNLPSSAKRASRSVNSKINEPSASKNFMDVNLLDLNSSELLVEAIQASNRTTHAIRAIVRFFLVQLSFITLAYFAYFMNSFTVDEDDCARWEECSPSSFGSFLVFAIFAVGVFISSRLAWAELERSNIEGVHSGKTLNF